MQIHFIQNIQHGRKLQAVGTAVVHMTVNGDKPHIFLFEINFGIKARLQVITPDAAHIMIERIKQNKSLVDIKLTARACQEHYQKQVDSFVIVSSDSDYWGLISSLPDARFLVMIEREKCGPDMKAALAESGIFYCYLDDFYSGNSEDIKKNALFKEMYRWIDNSVHLNVNDMFDAALRNTRIEMSPAERRQFYEKHIRHMTLTIDENGNVSIELKRG